MEEHVYYWLRERAACRARYGELCGDCGRGLDSITKLEVHHIIPIGDGRRLVSSLNRPSNLILLCRTCHLRRHATAKNQERITYDFSGLSELVSDMESGLGKQENVTSIGYDKGALRKLIDGLGVV